MHDAGICTICTVEWDETTIPKSRELLEVAQVAFEERTVGIERYYEAAKNGHKVDRLIRIWRRVVSTRQVCVIGEIEYHIEQVQYTTDADGLLVTDLALEEYNHVQNQS